MKESQFAILMSGLFVIGGNIDNNLGLHIVSVLWLFFAVYLIWNKD